MDRSGFHKRMKGWFNERESGKGRHLCNRAQLTDEGKKDDDQAGLESKTEVNFEMRKESQDGNVDPETPFSR